MGCIGWGDEPAPLMRDPGGAENAGAERSGQPGGTDIQAAMPRAGIGQSSVAARAR